MTSPGTKIAEIFRTPGGTIVIRGSPVSDLPFSLAAITRKQCDGSWVIEPLGNWISPGEAARLMGVHECSVLRLRDLVKPDGSPILEFRRPTPFRVQISLASVIAHLEHSKDPEFWTSCKGAATALHGKE